MNECDPVIEEIPENEVNVATRQTNLANALGVGDWARKIRAKERSSIIDTGLNGGGGLRSSPLLRRYVEYLRSFYAKDNLVRTREKELRFALANHQGRTSCASTVLPIWANGTFRPVRVRLIRGKSELLSGMHIVKKPGVAVCFRGDRFKVGQVECDMVTFNENHHWVFPLAPTASAYTKLDEYFGKLQNRKSRPCKCSSILVKIRLLCKRRNPKIED